MHTTASIHPSIHRMVFYIFTFRSTLAESSVMHEPFEIRTAP